MDEVLAALTAQTAELDGLLSGLAAADWQRPSACPGWTIADVVLHLAQTDEYATASARQGLAGEVARTGWLAPGPGDDTVDDAAAAFVAAESSTTPAELLARWRHASRESVEALAACEPATRVRWATGDLAARTLATTRLSECWIHTTDVAEGLGVDLAPTDRLWHVARLAHRTLPYAFARAGAELHGPVVFRLTSPGDPAAVWEFASDTDTDTDGGVAGREPTVIAGSAHDLCCVAARRRDASATGLVGSGPDAAAVLALVRTFA